jgi:hypothetical protein
VDLDLPAEGQAQAPGRFRGSGEHLLGPDELYPFGVAAGHLESHNDLGDRESVARSPSAARTAVPRFPSA